MKKYYLALSDTVKGYLLMSGFIFSATMAYLLIDLVFRQYPQISPENAIFWGFGGAAIIGLFYFVSSTQKRNLVVLEFKKYNLFIIAVSLFAVVGAMLWFWAMSAASGGIVSLLTKSQTIFAFLLGILFLKEKFSLKEGFGILIAIMGILIIANLEGEISSVAVLATLTSSILYALQSLLVKKAGTHINAPIFSFLRVVVTTTILAIILLSLQRITLIPPLAFLTLALSQVFGFFIGRIFYFEAHKFLPISKLNMVTLFTPVLILIGEFIFWGDTISWQKLIGSVLIIGGLCFFIREQFKLKKT